METYPVPMVPGPTSVSPEVLEAYDKDYGSADIEPEYVNLYRSVSRDLQTILATRNPIVIMTGEGMLALWSALKSCLKPGDRVLSIATGVFGFGIADMAKAIGARVKTVDFPYNQTIHNWSAVEKAIAQFKPKMITAVHCETPSGTLNPIAEVGALKKKYDVPLLYVDAVASLGGTVVLTDEWHIDLCLGGTQKCLSLPPAMAFLSVSPTAWEIIDRVNYVGYDALKPFRNTPSVGGFPYTPYWHGLAAMQAGTRYLLNEGLTQCFARHQEVAEYCRRHLVEAGYTLFPAADAIPAPTVTAVNVPDATTWKDFDARLRMEGVVVGGSYGPLQGKVFRLGHMGIQAHLEVVEKAVKILRKVRS